MCGWINHTHNDNKWKKLSKNEMLFLLTIHTQWKVHACKCKLQPNATQHMHIQQIKFLVTHRSPGTSWSVSSWRRWWWCLYIHVSHWVILIRGNWRSLTVSIKVWWYCLTCTYTKILANGCSCITNLYSCCM